MGLTNQLQYTKQDGARRETNENDRPRHGISDVTRSADVTTSQMQGGETLPPSLSGANSRKVPSYSVERISLDTNNPGTVPSWARLLETMLGPSTSQEHEGARTSKGHKMQSHQTLLCPNFMVFRFENLHVLLEWHPQFVG